MYTDDGFAHMCIILYSVILQRFSSFPHNLDTSTLFKSHLINNIQIKWRFSF